MTDNRVHKIYSFDNEHLFNEDEALDQVDLFLAITAKAKNKINALNSRYEYFKNQPDMAEEIQFELNQEIQKWSDKLRRLGGFPIELYKAKIPATDGYYIWEFPNASLEHYPQRPN